MRIVAALATLVKHLLPGSATRPGRRRQARTGAPGRPSFRLAGRPIRAGIGSYWAAIQR